MENSRFTSCLLLLLALAGCSQKMANEQAAVPPNIVLIVADDLGYSDIGSFGSEIRTPSLDALAAQGLKLTNFHTAPTCGPTRAMLMTGIDPHPVGMAANAAAVRRIEALQGRRGYEGRLNHDAVTVAALLSDAGYQTYMAGKWDLGSAEGSRPVDRGFQKSFALVNAGASHFSDARGVLSIDKKAMYLENETEVASLPENFYSSRFYTDQILEYIENGDAEKPFFAYVAYTAPHWPLQVPDDWLGKYSGQYDEGWRALSNSRLKKQLEMNLVNQIPDYVPARGVPEWNSLPAEERIVRAREMEIYAAMVEYMDWQIGLLLERVKALPSDRPTLVIFLSDNGPEGNAVDRIGGTGQWVAEAFNNDLDNMGKRNSYLWTGPGWAQASAQPHRLYKSFVSEGGIRTPAIIGYVGSAANEPSSDALVVATDIPATILDAAGVEHPGTRYAGRDILPMEGRSVLPILQGRSESIHDGEALGWELYGNRALIKDQWKATLIWPPAGNGEWQLFDVVSDPPERNNLGGQHPDKLDELVRDWNEYASDKGIYLFELDNGYGRY
jgi:arylsulfatase